MPENKSVAYFSMEIALDPAMPTYSGGLGVLAGDTLRAAADRSLPMIAVSLLHRKGYFSQSFDETGWQTEAPSLWDVSRHAEELPQRALVEIEDRKVLLRAWQFDVCGASGSRIPVYLLDTDLPENSEWDRRLTDQLYGGDKWYRLCQEIVLGIGGVRMLRALGYNQLKKFHMNEGHAAFLGLELLDEQVQQAGRSEIREEDVIAVHDLCVFTTHTPVPAGHDKFPMEFITRALKRKDYMQYQDILCCEGELNMTYLALNLSHYVNGVAKKHGEVSQHMFAQYKIDAITNGVHAGTWTSEPFQKLFHNRIAGWRDDSFMLRYALNIPQKEIWDAHQEAKTKLLDRVQKETGVAMDPHTLTLGFARRAATYKRADLVFHDLDRLKSIADNTRKFQIVFAGKAHPQDQEGKRLIQGVWKARDALKGSIDVVYLTDYGWDLGLLMTSGVDVWLNTPKPPMEASGTSGMKAALNGVPSLSILDGWWIEGCIEGTTGWAIDSTAPGAEDRTPHDAESLYDKLENVVIPLYYQDHDGWLDMMRHAIALNGSFFNTQRMVLQYVLKAYFA
jgi:starch phosphorylase